MLVAEVTVPAAVPNVPKVTVHVIATATATGILELQRALGKVIQVAVELYLVTSQ